MVRLVRPVAEAGVGGGHEVWSLGPGFPAGWPMCACLLLQAEWGGERTGDSGVAPRSTREGKGCGERLSGPPELSQSQGGHQRATG